MNGYNNKDNYRRMQKQKINKKINITLLNLPYCKYVKSNIGKKFLKVINQHLGEKSN